MREIDPQHLSVVTRRLERDAFASRIAFLEADLAAARDHLQKIETEHDKHVDQLKASLSSLTNENEQLRATLARHREADAEEELTTCRAIADRCIFIIGFGRSNTTITLQMLNCAANALLLGEANFFLGEHAEQFSAGFNRQHCEFRNQVTKSSHAPDFLPDEPHRWWQWLAEATQFYDYVGEKIALSPYHMGKVPSDAFRSFHEARFFTSRYIFTLRNPVSVLLSLAKLLNVTEDRVMVDLISAWLSYMQLWSDCIRVFPHTLTLVADQFGQKTIEELEGFTGLDLGDAHLLIDPANQKRHKLTARFPTLVRFRSDLEDLFADAVAATNENRVLWQAEQKTVTQTGPAVSNTPGEVALHPLGRVWLRARLLHEKLAKSANENLP
ncbi:MAG: sulfotransferase [Sphingomonas bacterium]